MNIDPVNILAALFAGAFLCNGIPHLVSGLLGAPFPSPFSSPRGVGPSSPLVNFYWGAFNLAIALTLLVKYPLSVGINPSFAALFAGALLIGTFSALHFGKVRKDQAAKS